MELFEEICQKLLIELNRLSKRNECSIYPFFKKYNDSNLNDFVNSFYEITTKIDFLIKEQFDHLAKYYDIKIIWEIVDPNNQLTPKERNEYRSLKQCYNVKCKKGNVYIKYESWNGWIIRDSVKEVKEELKRIRDNR